MEKTRRKVRPIARKRHNYIYLLLAILFAILTGYIFFNFSPDYKFEFGNFGIPILPIFFISLSAFIFSFVTFLFIRKVQGFITVSFILFYLSLRLIGLTHWIFAVMFIALFIAVEVLFYGRR